MICCNIVDSVALHIDNAAQVNKPQPAEEVPEELIQDPPIEVLQTIEEKQETKEADKIISITNEHEVMHRHAISNVIAFSTERTSERTLVMNATLLFYCENQFTYFQCLMFH